MNKPDDEAYCIVQFACPKCASLHVYLGDISFHGNIVKYWGRCFSCGYTGEVFKSKQEQDVDV